MHLSVGLLEQPVGEHSHNKDVDQKADQQGYTRLNKVIQVGVPNFLRFGPVHVPGLDQGGVQVQIVRHYDRSYYPDALDHRPGVATLAPRYEHALHDAGGAGHGGEVLVPEGDAHYGDQEAEERLKFAQAVLVQQQEREGVGDGEQDSSPNGNAENLWYRGVVRLGRGMLPSVGQEVKGHGGSNYFLHV